MASLSRTLYRLTLATVLIVQLSLTAFATETTLTVYSNIPPGTGEFDALQAYFRKYEAANPGIKIEDLGRISTPDALYTLVAAGTAPDLFGFTTHPVFALYEQGYISDVPHDILAKANATLLPVTLEANTLRGKLIGLPSQNNVTTMYYNKRLMSEAGLGTEPPSTWDELAQMSRKTTTPDRFGLITSPDGWSLTRFSTAMLWSFGGEVVDETGRIVLGGDPFMQVLSFFEEAFRPDSFGSLQYSRIFNNSEAAFMLGIPGQLSGLRDANPLYAQETGAAPLPAGPAGSRANHYGHTYAVAKGPNEIEAWKLLDWLMFSSDGPNGMTPLGDVSLQRGYPPYHLGDVAAGLENHPDAAFYHGFIDTLLVARNYEHWWEFGIVDLPTGPGIRRVINGEPHIAVIDEIILNLERQIAEAQQ